MLNKQSLPDYDDLSTRADAPPGSAWGVFGDDDEVGCLNLITRPAVVEAASLVRKGTIFSLNLPIDLPDPPLFGRGLPQHNLLASQTNTFRDDYIDGFWPQTSSQWDGLRHIRHPQDGFYNRVGDNEIVSGGGKLGIEKVASRGIAARGVLLDVERFLREEGRPIDQRTSFAIDVALLQTCAQSQGVVVKPGDILLVRTGWLRWYLEEATQEEKESIGGKGTAATLKAPGLSGAEENAAFLWNNRVAAVAADNPSLEVWPPGPEGGFLHYKLIPHLGMMIGELWYLEDLAADCAADEVYEFFLTSAPINITGGVGSPANALAIK